jgi:hypothetical protein
MLWILLIVFGLLWWWRLHPYIVTRDQMKDALARVVEKKMPADEWDKLLRKRIPRDRYLESVRERLLSLPMKYPPPREGALDLYDSATIAKVSSLLDELRTKRA